MSNEVVLDIETANTFQDVGGYFPDKLDVSVVVAYFYETDEYVSYLLEDLPKLFERLERSGNTAVPDGTWSAFSSEYTDPFGTDMSAQTGQYIQYRASLSTTDEMVTPSLNDITITYK